MGRHWDDTYGARGVEGVSWYQPEPVISLDLIRLLGVGPSEPVIDVGGGASTLVDRLSGAGFGDLTVLDISAVALGQCRQRLEDHPPVTLVHADVLAWRPARHYGLWHDRAVFHFLVEERDRTAYLAALSEALEPDGAVIMATFAGDGPPRCSGLPVARYSPAELAGVLGSRFHAVASRREIHRTPRGQIQPFSWIAARMGPPPGSG